MSLIKALEDSEKAWEKYKESETAILKEIQKTYPNATEADRFGFTMYNTGISRLYRTALQPCTTNIEYKTEEEAFKAFQESKKQNKELLEAYYWFLDQHKKLKKENTNE